MSVLIIVIGINKKPALFNLFYSRQLTIAQVAMIWHSAVLKASDFVIFLEYLMIKAKTQPRTMQSVACTQT